MNGFAGIAEGRERRAAASAVPRHRHDRAYAAIVLLGGYEESGNNGRFRVAAGDVLVHDAFDAHLDRFGHLGAEILNLALTTRPAARAGRVRDPEALARLAATDLNAARGHLLEQFFAMPLGAGDWPDLLAADLSEDPDLQLSVWADAHGLAAETLSRGFGKLYGMTPNAFRAEARARRAYDRIKAGDLPFAEIATQTGHADQPHMTRAIKALTGAAPGHWRRSRG
jgi:AraC-like DNA-binding protein